MRKFRAVHFTIRLECRHKFIYFLFGNNKIQFRKRDADNFSCPANPKSASKAVALAIENEYLIFSCRTGSTPIPRMASYRQQLWLIQNLIKIFSFHKIAIKGVFTFTEPWLSFLYHSFQPNIDFSLRIYIHKLKHSFKLFLWCHWSNSIDALSPSHPVQW